jgi:hypothetical protein
MFSLGLISLLTSTAKAVTLDAISPGDLVITEIMHNPDAVADYRGEYIEIYNASNNPIDINGLQVVSSNEAGFTVSGSLTIAAGEYAVLAAKETIALNGGNLNVDYEYPYSSFKITSVETITLSNNGTTFDTVSFNSSYPLIAGAALILDSGNLTSSANDNVANWCISGNVFGTGDYGTPGSANDGCNTIADLSAGDIIISEFMVDPTKVADYRGEWIELYNTTNESYNLNGLQISSSGDSGHTISSDVNIPAKGYVVISVKTSPAENGGIDNVSYAYPYSGIRLLGDDSLSLSNGAVTLDTVTFQRFSPHWPGTTEAGQSSSLTPSLLDSTSNNSLSSWCVGSTIYGDGDFGTPGEANDICPNADGDGDGLTADEDCDDTDANITVNTYYRDNDSDTYGNPNVEVTGCSAPAGYVEDNTDCNDSNSSINPGAVEICDDVDNDCDNSIDDADAGLDTGTATTWYHDGDSDNYGDDLDTLLQCDSPADYIAIGGDCDDNNAGINPGATDIELNGIDEDCSGSDNTGADDDGDGFTVAEGDCNDGNASINPNAAEVCDGIDNDCDGGIDDNDLQGATNASTWFVDSDSDGFGGSTTIAACNRPAGTFATSTDCDDSNANIFPDATETLNDGIDQDCDGGDLCYNDADDDGFLDANPGTRVSADLDCNDPFEGTLSDPKTDCNDSLASVSPGSPEICDSLDNDCDGSIDDADADVDTSTGSTYYRDADNDLFGDLGDPIQSCGKPSGYSTNSLDCDDNDASLKPIDSDGDGVDRCSSDCDDFDDNTYPGAGSNEPANAAECMTDVDGDGYGDPNAPANGFAGTDCDDNLAAINPGATEVCDDIDNDCDNSIDEGLDQSWFADIDSDGFGNNDDFLVDCAQPAGYIADNTDCDDNNAAINPGAAEICDGIDNDCDNSIDDGVTTTFYADNDADGFGSNANQQDACSAPAGYVSDNTDCDDGNNAVNPGATEVCDGIDNDCDNSIDEGVTTTFYADNDSDGFGNNADQQDACSAPANHVTDNTDCDDNNAAVNPGATEVCDSLDNDCDNSIDEGVTTTFYADTDSDGFGSNADQQDACSAPAGYVSDNTDCDDGNNAVNPGATEVCDGIDNDCDNSIDDGLSSTTYYVDSDSDGFGNNAFPEVSCTQPDGYVTDNTDCDDGNNAVNPGATEVCDGIDNDCDNSIDEGAATTTYFEDADSDGFGNAGSQQEACSQPDGYVTDNTDCDDTTPLAFPGGTETCLDGIDGDCDGADSTGTCDGNLSNDDFTVTGISASDRLGQALSYAGNITGSASEDFAVGSRWRNSENGAVYVFAGGSLSGTSSASAANAVISGQSGERFGQDVAGGTTMLGGITGDINGDGNDDLIVGAPYGDGDGANRGRAYIFYGPLSGALSSSSADVIIYGEKTSDTSNVGANAGSAVAIAGDVNNDGFADVLISDPNKAHNFGANGEAYLLFGGNALDSQINLQDLGADRSYGLEIHSHSEDNNGWESMGSSLDAVGDVNGDGIDDIAVAAYRWDTSTPLPCASANCGAFGSPTQKENHGAVFVWYGSSTLHNSSTNLTVSHVTPTNHTADVTFIGENAGDQIGRSLAGAGDFNGDGNMDIIVGSEHFNSSRGAAYVVAGDVAGSHTLSPANSAVFLKMTGEATGDAAGRWVGSAGNLDADGNGTSDVLVGAKLADANGADSGAVYVVLGGPSVTGTMSLSAADAMLAGQAAGDETGINVSGIGDMDADGVPEILIGSYRNGSAAGAVQLIFGGSFQ